jgi:hypothetical protein
LQSLYESIQAVGANNVKPYSFWTSSIFNNTENWLVNTNVGRVATEANRYGLRVKPIALV